jgi:hypothetical protein
MDRAEFAAQEVRAQLKNRNWRSYNRNLFSVKTGDKEGHAVRTYCEENDLNPNQFLNKLIKDFFNA